MTEPAGLLLLDKPSGPTSHDCVARCRKLFGTKKMGHAGTLDPLASGLLVLAVGRATRLLEYLLGAGKSYQAEVRFGVATDTYDAAGTVTERGDPSGLTRELVEAALSAFRGLIDQVPPPVSAKQVGGKRLHALHRAGQAVELPPCRVEVTRLELTRFTPGEHASAALEVDCGSGTYLRSLAHDLGRALGCGAHLTALRRTRVGRFAVAEAVTFDRLEAAADRAALLLPPESAVAELPAATTAHWLYIAQGKRLSPEQWSGAPDGPVRLMSAGRLLAVGRAESGGFVPEKVFIQPDEVGGAAAPWAEQARLR